LSAVAISVAHAVDPGLGSGIRAIISVLKFCA
jgi:hypothetical protein